MPDPARTVAAVVIGRNEGARLTACLTSLQGQTDRIVYVDSGSSDGSAEAAADLGAEVVTLDMSLPFTAARARNAGARVLADSGVTYIQFVDGDCVVAPGWVATARGFLDAAPDHAVACGRRREAHPEASVYNRLCDREWDTPIGEATACGGDALIRRAALDQIGGYRDDLIAGEEPEMCLRLRRKGWKIRRLEAEMTLHDARLMRFGQWWTRTRRAGHAFAEGAALHGAGTERHWVAETRRALFWGAGLPALILVLAFFQPPALALALVYPVQIWRLARRSGYSRAAWEWAAFTVLGKFPEAIGVLSFWRDRMRGRKSGLIEYK